jgi:hypothetical protein
MDEIGEVRLVRTPVAQDAHALAEAVFLPLLHYGGEGGELVPTPSTLSTNVGHKRGEI